MAASFTNASSQRILNAALPIVSTAYPCTVAFWANPTQTASARAAVAISDSGSTNHYLNVFQSTSWGAGASAGGTQNNATTGTPVIGSWAFVAVRFIASANRRISVLDHIGAISHGSTTTARDPAGLDNISIGSREGSSPTQFYDGSIAEFWYTATDIQADGTQLNNDLFRQLAFRGPFAIPHIAQNLVDYRSLRASLGSDTDGDETFISPFGRQTWVNTNAAVLAPHPPLPYWYERPGQRRATLVI